MYELNLFFSRYLSYVNLTIRSAKELIFVKEGEKRFHPLHLKQNEKSLVLENVLI